MILMGFFLGILIFFACIVLAFAGLKRSWGGMLLGGLALLPFAWFISMYPPFPWAIYVPLVPFLMAVVLFFRAPRARG